MIEQHTPGPWIFKPDPNGKQHYWVKRDGGFVICRVSGHGEADARLIAAAPEMRAALERLCDKTAISVTERNAVWASAEAALAKATTK